MSDSSEKRNFIIGAACAGGITTGAFALIAGSYAFVYKEFISMGICLISAALAFGLVASAILRK